MAKKLVRSKSVSLKRPKQSTHDLDQPLPVSIPQFPGTADLPVLSKATPKRADSGTASASGDEIQRPMTANSALTRSRTLHTTGARIVVQADEQTFDFPTPSPEAVYQSREMLNRDPTIPIGMAIGSPSQNNATAWKQSHPAPPSIPDADPNVDTTNDADAAAAAHPTTGDGKKPKVSRWKSLFGRRAADKPPATPAPFYQLQPSVPQTPAVPARLGVLDDPIQSQASLAESVKSKGGKPKTRLRSKSSAAADRPALFPLDPPQMPKIPPAQGSPKLSAKELEKKKPSRFGKFPDFHHKEPRPPIIRAETSPMLKVDIPTIEMERYSVMFGQLLKDDRQSNLLMRRQGNPERLMPLNADALKVNTFQWFSRKSRMANLPQAQEDEEKGQIRKPTRRATSPATPTFQTPTLGLSLFPRDSMSSSRAGSPAPARGQSPAPARALNPPNAHHRLQRSFTAPISPSRPVFDADHSDAPSSKEKPIVAKCITEEPETDKDMAARKKELVSPTFTASTRDSDASYESVESNETAILVKEKGMKPKFSNDVDVSGWEIVTKKQQQPMLHVQTKLAQGSLPGGSTLSLQTQSPLTSLSGQSFAQAKETVARQNSLRRREREQAQASSPATSIQASPKRDQQGRKPSYASSHGPEPRDKDAEMMLQQQQQFRERKQQKQGEEQPQQPQQPQQQQQQSNLPKRQPTLKERAEEVQNAGRLAIARQVSISRQRAQQELLRAQQSKAGGSPIVTNAPNATKGIGSMTISSNQKAKSRLQSPSTTSLNAAAAASATTPPAIVVPDDNEPKPKLARQESLRRAGRNGAATTRVTQSPTGERLVQRRTLTPVLVDIPNRKSVAGNIVDESDFDAPPLPMPPTMPFAFADDPHRASTVSFSHLNC